MCSSVLPRLHLGPVPSVLLGRWRWLLIRVTHLVQRGLEANLTKQFSLCGQLSISFEPTTGLLSAPKFVFTHVAVSVLCPHAGGCDPVDVLLKFLWKKQLTLDCSDVWPLEVTMIFAWWRPRLATSSFWSSTMLFLIRGLWTTTNEAHTWKAVFLAAPNFWSLLNGRR